VGFWTYAGYYAILTFDVKAAFGMLLEFWSAEALLQHMKLAEGTYHSKADYAHAGACHPDIHGFSFD